MAKIFVISGPSGAGKGSIIKAIIDSKRPRVQWLRTATSRPPREDDIELGKHIFLTAEIFTEMIESGEFAEYNFYNGNYYGTPITEIKKAHISTVPAITEIDVNGSESLKAQYPADIVQIFINANKEDIVLRLQKRGMPDNLIEQRIEIAETEINKAKKFAYYIFNEQDRLEDAVNKVKEIIKRNS